MSISEAQKAEVAYYFEGSCNSVDAFEDDPDIPLTDDQVTDILLEKEIEMCSGCGWWLHQADLEEVDGEVLCTDCREDEEEVAE
ncbi:hypothetical protein ACJ7V3_11675 [Halomonas elongata]|uniref:hypothetical protein n=1 Tax=Halomonas elongata TaxID=2746 RepID=UPI0038D39E7C